MNYTDAMSYFYRIAPFTADDALKYASEQAFWFVLGSIPIFAIIIGLLFLYETKLFKKAYQKRLVFLLKNFYVRGTY